MPFKIAIEHFDKESVKQWNASTGSLSNSQLTGNLNLLELIISQSGLLHFSLLEINSYMYKANFSFE